MEWSVIKKLQNIYIGLFLYIHMVKGVEDNGPPTSSEGCPRGFSLSHGYISGKVWHSGHCEKNEMNCKTYDYEYHKCTKCDIFYLLQEAEPGINSKCIIEYKLLLPVIIMGTIILVLIFLLLHHIYINKPKIIKQKLQHEKELEGKPFVGVNPDYIVDTAETESIIRFSMFAKDQKGETIGIIDTKSQMVFGNTNESDFQTMSGFINRHQPRMTSQIYNSNFIKESESFESINEELEKNIDKNLNWKLEDYENLNWNINTNIEKNKKKYKPKMFEIKEVESEQN